MEKETARQKMKIVADENIPFVEQAFAGIGEVAVYQGRNIDPSAVKEADILIIRSVTQVDSSLLKGSRVRYVATATIGYDHIDVEYLKKRGIGFAAASGSNANSVAEYIVAALLKLADRHKFSLSGKIIGVVGVGNVGSRIVEKTKILGMNVIRNDPPLARKTGDVRFHPLEKLLNQSDILTFHVPLTYHGQDATYHMAAGNLFKKMKKDSFLINTSRGAVVDGTDLLSALRKNILAGAVLDVWENEPEINEDLLKAVDIGTPHIAGYSLEGKTNGTVIVYRKICDFLKIPYRWELPPLPSPAFPEIEICVNGKSDEKILTEVIEKVYNIRYDDRSLRNILKAAPEDKKHFFDGLRKNYPLRREFNAVKINATGENSRVKRKLKELGFQSRYGGN